MRSQPDSWRRVGRAQSIGRVLAWTVAGCAAAWPAAGLQGAILAETKPFISPKGPFVTAEASYHTFRIPGMVVAADGSVLVFAEGRRGTGSDPRTQANAPMDLMMRRSTDNGLTWEAPVVIDSGFKESGAKVDFADPTPVLDQTTGTIHLVYGQWPDQGPITANWGSNPDSTNGNQVVWSRSSSDHGVTWSQPSQIDYPDHPNETADGLYWRNAEPGPGSGIQLQWHPNRDFHGRLVVPAKRSASATPTGPSSARGFVYYSDDHGATWLVGDVASAGGNENEVVELTDGDLLLDARANPRTRFTSSNGGSSWSNAPNSDIPVTTVDTSMVRFSATRDGDARDRLLHSGPGGTPVGSGSGRSNQLVWTSYDEGHTFINPVQFNAEQAAYSVLAKLHDGTLGMVVESTGNEPFNQGQNYGDITYYHFGIDHLEGAEHDPGLSHYDGFGNPIDALRGGVGWSGGWNNEGVSVVDGALEFAGFFTAGDAQHAKLRGAQMTRRLGAGSIDLDTNQDYYISIFINHGEQDGIDAEVDEWIDIQLQAGARRQFAFGVDSTEAFYIGNEIATSPVVSPAATLERGTTYLLLAKLVAQDGTAGGNADQLLLAWFDDPGQVPADDAQIDWQLAGPTSENFSSLIDGIYIGGGSSADWSVDGLRIGTSLSAVLVDTGVAGPPVLGDLNSDLRIDLADWLVLRGNMRLDTSGLSAEAQLNVGDFDQSGRIGVEDYVVFVDLFDAARGVGAFATALRVPEPSFLAMLVAGAYLYGVRRK